jgi:cysteine desulfurase/selenocysteine lyase
MMVDGSHLASVRSKPHPWRRDFPAIATFEADRLVYLDSAATTLKPRSVIDTVASFYTEGTASVHRGSYRTAELCTEAFELGREQVASFIGAKKTEVAFTFGCTDAINLVAQGLEFSPGDEVIVSRLEHHSNYLPWLAKATPRVVDIDDAGTIDLERLEAAFSPRTKLVAVTLASNVTGAVQPVAEICALARRRNVPVLVDAAQAMAHVPVDVRELGCSFLTFSGHKMFGPSGVGALFISAQTELAPARVGGTMVETVGETPVFRSAPYRYEAGTPNIEGVLGLAAAVRYLEPRRAEMSAYTERLADYARFRLEQRDGISIPFAAKGKRVPLVSFVPRVSGVDLEFVCRMLADGGGIALRGGTHCCQPLFQHVGLKGALRVSLGPYNTFEDVDALMASLDDVASLLR